MARKSAKALRELLKGQGVFYTPDAIVKKMRVMDVHANGGEFVRRIMCACSCNRQRFAYRHSRRITQCDIRSHAHAIVVFSVGEKRK